MYTKQFMYDAVYGSLWNKESGKPERNAIQLSIIPFLFMVYLI